MKSCALCQHFSAQLYKEYARLGMGRCAAKPVATFVRWDATACKQGEPAKDMEARIEWVSKRERGG